MVGGRDQRADLSSLSLSLSHHYVTVVYGTPHRNDKTTSVSFFFASTYSYRMHLIRRGRGVAAEESTIGGAPEETHRLPRIGARRPPFEPLELLRRVHLWAVGCCDACFCCTAFGCFLFLYFF